MAVSRGQAAHTGAPSSRRRGLTLVEAVVSVAIVGVMLTAALYALGGVAKARRVQIDDREGRNLAQQLLSEILQAAYTDPEFPESLGFGLEPDESWHTRADFDDVDDYAFWKASPPQAKDGAALPGYEGWRRAARVGPGFAADVPAEGANLVEVFVVSPKGEMTYLCALKSRYGEADPSVPEETRCVSWAGIELQVGGDVANRVLSGVSLLNRPMAE